MDLCYNMLGDEAVSAWLEANWQPLEQHVADACGDSGVPASLCPSTFITHAADDSVVPVKNALYFYSALVSHNIPAELHVYETGGHGYGFFRSDDAAAQWPKLLEPWLRGRQLID